MADWAYALSQGIAGAAQTGAGIIDAQMKDTAQANAEQRAADVKLDTQSRMMAIEDAMKTRAAERFSGVVKAKMGEEVPAAGDPVSKTGITHASGAAALAGRTVNGEQAVGLEADPATLQKYSAWANATLSNPDATAGQKEDARALMEQIGQQATEQSAINAKAAGGKTRHRTMDEAQQAALEDTLQNDAPAFMAGTGMLGAANKTDLEDKKMASREKIAKTESDRKERADNLRYDALMARIDAAAEGRAGKSGSVSALRQNVDMLKELGYGPDKIEKFIFDKKEIPVEDIAAKLLASDKFGEMSPEQATAKAMAIKTSAAKLSGASPAGAPGGSAPKPLTYDPTTRTFK